MSVRRARLATAVLGVAALAGGGCGSDSDGGAGGSGGDAKAKIRAVLTEFEEVRDRRQWQRACGLLTPRAAAQMTAIVGGGADDCATSLRRSEPEDDLLSAAQSARASITVRGDRALFVARKDGPRAGLRDVDGDWRIDNILNPSLEEPPRRIDPRLSAGSDEQQVRATQKAVTRAFAKRDYERMCDLYGYGAEAQLFIATIFTTLEDGPPEPAGGFTCASAVRRLEKLAGDSDEFAAGVLSDEQIDAATITIDGDRATVRIAGEDPEYMVRQDGRWLVGPDPKGFS